MAAAAATAAIGHGGARCAIAIEDVKTLPADSQRSC
jgi:hypothetical protein